MSAFTPGPWEVIAGDNYMVRSPLIPPEYPHKFKADSTGDAVAYIGNHTDDFGEANARLIAAAPDLLAALQTVLVGLKNGCVKSKPLISFDENAESADMQALEEIVSAAIDKATP